MSFRALSQAAAAAAVALTISTTAHGRANFDHYRFSIVASTQATFTSFGDNVSINKQGTVAFVGTSAGVEQAYRAEINALPDALTNVPTAVYGRAVQINDGNLVLTRDRLGSGSPPPTRIRFWQFTGAFTQIAVGGSNQPYASVFSHPTINNNAQVVYTGLVNPSLDRVMSDGFVDVPISAAAARPMLADTGQVVLNDNGVLKLYSQGLGGFTTLATVGGGFTELGNAPGISDDGRIVVFSGNEGTGRGVFASVPTAAGRQRVLIAGGGAPANPTRVNLPDLGFAENGAPLFFADVDLANRVGVAHYPGGAAGLEGDSFIAAFLATPNAASDPDVRDNFVPGLFFENQRGLFTVRVDIVSTNPLQIRRHVAQPVMQVGSRFGIGASTFTVADIQLHDPIDVATADDAGNPLTRPLGSHRLAFWVSDGANQFIFRATQLNACLLPVVRLGQATPPWGNDRLAGHPQISIQGKGCALAALTVAANRAAVDYGIDNAINPGQLNTQLIAGRGFVGRNVQDPVPDNRRVKSVHWTKGVQILRKPGRLFSAAPNALRFEPFKRSTLKPAQAQAARDFVANSVCDAVAPAPVIVGTDFVINANGNSVPHHFVVVSGIVNGRFVIADVGYHDRTTLDDTDGDYENQFVTRGRLVDPTDLSSLTVAADDDVDFVVTDPLGRRVGFDAATNTEFEEVPGSAFFDDALRDIPSGEPAAASTRSAILPQVAAGNFTIAVRGRITGPFALLISGIDSDGNDHPDIEISDTIVAGALKTYSVAYSGSPGATTTLVSTTVPNVVGEVRAAAEAQILASGLTVGTVTLQPSATVPAGSVVSQSIPGGTLVAAATAVNLVVSTGTTPVTVPNVVGQTQAQASAAIVSAGLVVGTVSQQSSATVPAGNVISQSPAGGTQVAGGSAVDLVISSGPALVAVPNVVGQTQAAAQTAILAAGLSVGTVTTQSSPTVPAGNVISQNPASGTQVAAGSAVNLVISSGPAQVSVPNVVGQTQAAAQTAITAAGLSVGTVTTQVSPTVPAGNVISQNPSAGTSVAAGTAVNLVVSSGAALIVVPNVVGQTQAAAQTAIIAAGLTVGTITTQSSATVAAGNVISQNPAAATSVAAGSAVSLVVSSGPTPVIVPNVVGQTQAAAQTAIIAAGLAVGTITTQSSATVAAGNVISQNPAAATSVAAGSAVSLVVSSGPTPVIVPNVVGQTQAAAQTAIIAAGLAVGTITTQSSATVAAGNVISQNPAAATSVAAGSAVSLVVSSGPAPVIVPNVVGQTQAAAQTAIIAAGLAVGTITTQSSATVAAGNVISQNPAAATSVAAGSAVSLVVSSGPAQGTVPNVVGQTQAAAQAAISTAGYTTGVVSAQISITVPEGLVISQQPPAGTAAAPGTAVALQVSWGNPAILTPGFAITRSGLVLNRATNTFDQTLTLTSASAPVLSPLFVSLGSLPAGVSLANRTAVDPVGRPYVRVVVPAGLMREGDAAKVLLKFSNPGRLPISYTVDVNGFAAN